MWLSSPSATDIQIVGPFHDPYQTPPRPPFLREACRSPPLKGPSTEQQKIVAVNVMDDEAQQNVDEKVGSCVSQRRKERWWIDVTRAFPANRRPSARRHAVSNPDLDTHKVSEREKITMFCIGKGAMSRDRCWYTGIHGTGPPLTSLEMPCRSL